MERKTKKGRMTQVTTFLCALLLLLCPTLITVGLAMLEVLVLEQLETMPAGLGYFCTVVVVLLWLATAVVTKLRLRTRLFYGPMPKTGLVLSGLLTVSVLFYVLGFAMEQDVLTLVEGVWAVCRLFGIPVSVSVGGVQAMLSCEIGTAAMLTCGIYLLTGLIAAFPVSEKKTNRHPAKAAA